MTMQSETPKRGFAAWDREKVKLVAQMGGKAAHASGRAHQYNTDEARENGRKGGLATQAKRKAEKP